MLLHKAITSERDRDGCGGRGDVGAAAHRRPARDRRRSPHRRHYIGARPRADARSGPLAETITRKVVTCDRNETIATIMERITMGFRHVPVYSHGLSACDGPSGVTARSSGFVAGHRCFLYPSCPAPLAGEGREGQP